MQKNSSILAEKLAERLRGIDKVRVQIENITASGQLSQRAATQLYEGMFLNAHVAFEAFLEELFIGLLVDGKGFKSSRRNVSPRISVKSHAVARDILTPKKREYIDWVPYKGTIELAEKYFTGGRPFSELEQPEKDHIFRCYTIRNVIAHDSRDSRSKFQNKVLQSTPLSSREKTPAGYLRGLYRTAPNQTRFENFLAQLLQIARKLAK